MKRRILSVILAVVLIVGAVPAITAAELDLAESVAINPEAEPETAAESVTDAPSDLPAEADDAEDVIAPTADGWPEITRITPIENGLKITWNAYDGAAKYFVFTKKDNGGWKKIGETTELSFEHKGLVSNTTYVYTVRAANNSGAFISEFNPDGWSFLYFAAPKLNRLESASNGQKLTWDPVEGADCYMVYIKSGDTWKTAGTTDTSYCVNTRVTSGKTYSYTVRCWDIDENVPLSYFDTDGISGVYIAMPQITAFNATANGVTVGWDAVDGAVYYALFQKTASGWKRLVTTADTSFTHSPLTAGTTYTYTVRCLNNSRQFISDYYTRGWSFTPTAPPQITDIRFRDTQYEFKWNAVARAKAYRVFRKEYGGKWKYLGETDATSFVDAKAQKTGVYTYTVRAMDNRGNYLTYYTDTGKYYCMGIFIIGYDGTGKPNTTPRYFCEVTENELREIVAKTALGWMGAVEGDAIHADILAYYNTYVPLAAGYTMTTHDAWCAAFTSAVWIRTGLAPYICTECGCGRFIDNAEAVNIWVENDAYKPKVGDAIIYNWSDSGGGECTWGADHVGIVTSVSGNNYVVTEGNTGDGVVDSHDRVVDQQYIRGYIAPNYKLIARFLSLKARYS